MKIMLIKDRGRLTYLLNKNLQIRLWHKRLEYRSNARVASRLTNRIVIGDDQHEYEEEKLSSKFEKDEKDNSKPFTMILLKTTDINGKNIKKTESDIEQRCNTYIKTSRPKSLNTRKLC